MFQKKVLVLAGLMAMAAAAQAQVKVYGYLDLGLGSYQSAGAKKVTQVAGGNMMTSFIGFSGSEDLGGGLKAEFALETFIGPDTGSTVTNNAGQFWGRASNVALSGGFGKLTVGQYDSPLFILGLSYNPFGSSMYFSPTMRHYYGWGTGVAGDFGGADVGNAALGIDTGLVNSVTYETPDMSGLTATVQWAAKESNTPGAKDTKAIAVAYNAGPLSAMLAYGDNGATNANTAYTAEQKVTAVGASYDFGVVKAFAQYTNVNNSDASGLDDAKIYQLGASVPVSAAGKVLVSYGQLKYDNNGGKDKITSLAYDHSLSKRTGVYVGYTTERATGLKTGNSYAVGVRHSF